VLSPKLKTPYSEQATIALERQIAKDMVLTVSEFSPRRQYLRHAGHQRSGAWCPFTYTITGAPANFPTAYTTQVYTGARPNPAFGAIYELTNGVSSWYDGLSASLRRDFPRIPVDVVVHMVHAIDDGQALPATPYSASATHLTYNGHMVSTKAARATTSVSG